MFNEFGYDTTPPNPPFHLRDVQNKCPECGAIFVAPGGTECPACAPNKMLAVVDAAMDALFSRKQTHEERRAELERKESEFMARKALEA